MTDYKANIVSLKKEIKDNRDDFNMGSTVTCIGGYCRKLLDPRDNITCNIAAVRYLGVESSIADCLVYEWDGSPTYEQVCTAIDNAVNGVMNPWEFMRNDG